MIKTLLGYDFDLYTADTFPYEEVTESLEAVRGKGIRKGKKGMFYSKQVCAFDIETTPIKGSPERTCMYHWQFSFDNVYYCIGRSWKEFEQFFTRFKCATATHIVTICVHNLSYEFGFMTPFLLRAFGDCDIEALMLSNHAPLNITIDNLKIIDTLRMSGTSLEKMCDDYNLYYRKAVGALNYDKLFNTASPLTVEELGYCLIDVASLVEWYHKIEELRGYTPYNMPMTKTAFVRQPLREKMKPLKDSYYNSQVDSYEVFKMLRDMFQGGLTCINPERRNETIEGDIRCKDFTSSYPAVMCGERYYYPVSAYGLYSESIDLNTDLDEFVALLNSRCVLFRARFFNIRLKEQYKTGIISASKCTASINDYRANGKIMVADAVEKVVNEVEFMDILEHYEVSGIEVRDIYTAIRGKLPEVMREFILDLFQKKTQYKGIPELELDLMSVKADINSCYGMCAMNPVRDLFTFNQTTGETTEQKMDPNEEEEAYYKAVNKKNSFLHYRWGCYVTTWARHNIIKAMDACGEEWLYTDTDSVYYTSTPEVEEKLLALNEYFTEGQPTVTNERSGKADTLGMLCPDGEYKAFRGLGAKKYCLVKKDGSIKLTCAGVPKKAGGAMLNSIDEFRAGFVFDGLHTNKLTPVRNIEYIHVENVNGVETETASNIYLKPTDYILSDSIFDDIMRGYLYF